MQNETLFFDSYNDLYTYVQENNLLMCYDDVSFNTSLNKWQYKRFKHTLLMKLFDFGLILFLSGVFLGCWVYILSTLF